MKNSDQQFPTTNKDKDMTIKLFDNPGLDEVTRLAEDEERFFDAVDEVEWAEALLHGASPLEVFETWKASR